MRGNGDFEAKSPAIWEFDFMKTLEAQRFFCWAGVYSSSRPGITLESGAI
jgi:hypothetical protein